MMGGTTCAEFLRTRDRRYQVAQNRFDNLCRATQQRNFHLAKYVPAYYEGILLGNHSAAVPFIYDTWWFFVSCIHWKYCLWYRWGCWSRPLGILLNITKKGQEIKLGKERLVRDRFIDTEPSGTGCRYSLHTTFKPSVLPIAILLAPTITEAFNIHSEKG